jgi:uncharacterized protein
VRIGYALSHAVEIRPTEVERVPQFAADMDGLPQQDGTFVPDGFEFIYTTAGETRVEMVAEATRDARNCAEQIAARGGRGVKELRDAHIRVVQINLFYSAATSWDGNNDTKSIDKTIVATMSATPALK